MTHIITVPLSALTLSRFNIRKTRRADDIDQMVASIAAEGLLQNLTVARIPPDDELPAERYEVIAGGQRLRAMQILAERDQLPASLHAGIPVNVVAPEIAAEVGLAENTIRTAMHPHDEFVAFRDLAAAGTPVEDIAARFGVTPLVVERRLKLANVAPEILRAFRDDKLSVETMQAFALTDDWSAQLRIYEEATANGRPVNAHQVRRALTQREVPTTDKRVRFVGLVAYQEAGGAVRRDLFDNDGGGYCLDENLLDQLVEERLQAEAKLLEAAGWKFVHIERDDKEWQFINNCTRSEPTREKRVLTDAEQARLKEISDRISVLTRVIDDDDEAEEPADSSEYEAWLDERDVLSEERAALTADIEVYSDRQKAKAGCLIQMNHRGELEIERGLIPREGTKSEVTANKAQAEATGTKPEPAAPTLAESMIRRLTAHRTLALQAALFARRDIALKTLAHGLLLNLFYTQDWETRSALSVTAKDEHCALDRLQFTDVSDSRVMEKLAGDIAQLRTTLNVPPQRAKFWPWLLQQSEETVTALLALVAVVSLDATSSSIGPHPSDVLAAALDIDYADYWQPTVESFAGLVPKSLVLEALKEIDPSETHYARIANNGQKKDVVAAEVAPLLVRARWLPKPLRRPGYKPGLKAAPVADADVETLCQVVKAKKKSKAKAPAKKPTKKPAAKKKPAVKRKAAKKAA